MKKISVSEFDKLYRSMSVERVIFSSDNQLSSGFHEFELISDFKVMRIFLNPNIIRFENRHTKLTLNSVQYIEIIDENSVLGTIFAVICRNINRKSNSSRHVFIAQQQL